MRGPLVERDLPPRDLVRCWEDEVLMAATLAPLPTGSSGQCTFVGALISIDKLRDRPLSDECLATYRVGLTTN